MRTAEDIGIQVQRRLLGVIKPTPDAVIEPASCRERLASTCDWLAARLRGNEPSQAKSGRLLSFKRTGTSLGYPVYSVSSVRGGFYMGRLEFSNQWRRPRFKADNEAVFDQQCIAEIFAMMKEFR